LRSRNNALARAGFAAQSLLPPPQLLPPQLLPVQPDEPPSLSPLVLLLATSLLSPALLLSSR